MNKKGAMMGGFIVGLAVFLAVSLYGVDLAKQYFGFFGGIFLILFIALFAGVMSAGIASRYIPF